MEQVVAFGNTLHVSGRDAAALEQSLRPLHGRRATDWRQVESGLEDVFISLMETAKDNWSVMRSDALLTSGGSGPSSSRSSSRCAGTG